MLSSVVLMWDSGCVNCPLVDRPVSDCVLVIRARVLVPVVEWRFEVRLRDSSLMVSCFSRSCALFSGGEDMGDSSEVDRDGFREGMSRFSS
jgi:hypothetical protein